MGEPGRETVSILKVIVAGDGNVGKTSLIRAYTEKQFSQSRVATIGVDFHVHTLEVSGRTVKLSIWDMAGQERYKFFRADFYRGSQAAALVYDVSEPASFDRLVGWRAEICKITPDQRFIVVGNKVDLERRQADGPAREFARSIQSPYLETSCLTGQGVADMFLALARTGLGE